MMNRRAFFRLLLLLTATSGVCAQPAVRRVACVGDSITYGSGIAGRATNSYPAQLGRMLGSGWDVQNFGVSGATLLKQGNKPYWKEKAFEQAAAFAPDVVILKLGTNDTKPDNWAHAAAFGPDARAMIAVFRGMPSKPRVILCLPVPVFKDRWGINEQTLAGGVIPALRRAARESGCELVDLHRALAHAADAFPDGVHPDARGAGLAAARLAEAFQAEPDRAFDLTRALPPGAREGDFHGYRMVDFTLAGDACRVALPHQAAPGRPWIWRARFWGHEPQTDLALLDRGWHVAYCEVGGLYGAPPAVERWNRYYGFLRGAGLCETTVLEGMSRGGLIMYAWAAANPDKVAALYGDAPVCDIRSWPGGKGTGKGAPANWAECLKAYGLTEAQGAAFDGNPADRLEPLARAGVPILHVIGLADDVVPPAENSDVVEQRYRALGGAITVIRKDGIGHHPHSLKDPAPIVDFILRATGRRPALEGARPLNDE